jgi:hypothetical protein
MSNPRLKQDNGLMGLDFSSRALAIAGESFRGPTGKEDWSPLVCFAIPTRTPLCD